MIDAVQQVLRVEPEHVGKITSSTHLETLTLAHAVCTAIALRASGQRFVHYADNEGVVAASWGWSQRRARNAARRPRSTPFGSD